MPFLQCGNDVGEGKALELPQTGPGHRVERDGKSSDPAMPGQSCIQAGDSGFHDRLHLDETRAEDLRYSLRDDVE